MKKPKNIRKTNKPKRSRAAAAKKGRKRSTSATTSGTKAGRGRSSKANRTRPALRASRKPRTRSGIKRGSAAKKTAKRTTSRRSVRVAKPKSVSKSGGKRRSAAKRPNSARRQAVKRGKSAPAGRPVPRTASATRSLGKQSGRGARASSATRQSRNTTQDRKSAATLAASVFSRRAARAEGQTAGAVVKGSTEEIRLGAGSRGKGVRSKRGSRRAARPKGSGTSSGKRPVVRMTRPPQFNYMKAPDANSGFDVGDTVEVLCDHEADGERIRGWIRGVVVQVDNKLVAVQFRTNVYLTDGWMVPDRILWYALSSDQIRAKGVARKTARAAIPEY